MRIIGGTYRSKKFHPPKNNPARPTTDMAKEGLFNILQNYFEFSEINALDLFGGTGSISYELASRGCNNITNVEMHGPNVSFIKKTNLELKANIIVLQEDVFRFLNHCNDTYDFIFAGPPYPLTQIPSIPDIIFTKNILNEQGLLVLETNPDHSFEQHPKFYKKRNYGTTIFHFFKH